MFKNRSSIVIVGALLVTASLLVHQGVATAQVVSGVQGTNAAVAGAPAAGACAFTADDIRSMRSTYVPQMGHRLARTERNFAGVDGGALGILACGAHVR